jgi:hypothetical protein
MQAYRLETVIQKDGSLILNHLPLKAGSNVEVVILVQPVPSSHPDRYPLRGKPITYLNPLEPVAQSDWSTSQ